MKEKGSQKNEVEKNSQGEITFKTEVKQDNF